jgi:hypothetical protein
MQTLQTPQCPYRPVPTFAPAARLPSRPRPAPLRPKELAAVLGVVVAADVALFSADGAASGGFGLALLLVVVPAAMTVAARARAASWRLAAVAVMLAAVALRTAFAPTVLTTLSGIALVAGLAFVLRAKRAFVPEAVATTLYGAAKLPSRLVAAWAGARRLVARTRLGRVAVLPVVVPLGLGVVFVAVFALANPVVARGVSAAGRALASLGLPSPLRVLAWAVALVVGVALLRPAVRLARGSEAAGAVGEATDAARLVARNTLVLLNVLFLGYDVLDATYLWSGRPPAGMTTQQYAHEGAFWLTVALAMLTAVVGVMFRGALAHDPRAALARTLAYAWMAQGMVLALGTYRRIAIHIVHSGLSDLRIVGILGTTLVAGGVALVAYKLKTRRTLAWLVRRQLDAFVVTVVLYAVTPTHLVSAKVNVARIASGENGPLLHMFRQSKEAESAATLLPLLHHPDAVVRRGVGALLEDERCTLRADVERRATWRERDLLAHRALDALDAAEPDIRAALGTTDATDPAQARLELLALSRAAAER